MDGEASEGEDGLGETVCPCGKVYEEGMFMIQCDICRDWMHGECVRYDVMVIIVEIIFIDICSSGWMSSRLWTLTSIIVPNVLQCVDRVS